MEILMQGLGNYLLEVFMILVMVICGGVQDPAALIVLLFRPLCFAPLWIAWATATGLVLLIDQLNPIATSVERCCWGGVCTFGTMFVSLQIYGNRLVPHFGGQVDPSTVVPSCVLAAILLGAPTQLVLRGRN